MSERDLEASRSFWDGLAATFDQEPDHGLREPAVFAAWRELLASHLPEEPQEILDLGCGTGSLSVLLAELGHHVSGGDLSPEMIAFAEQKAKRAGRDIEFSVMDAAEPPLERLVDVIVCQHVLWTLPHPEVVLGRWVDLLRPQGRLVLIEGYWKDAGLHAEQLIEALPENTRHELRDLSDQQALWAGPVNDERYILVAHLTG